LGFGLTSLGKFPKGINLLSKAWKKGRDLAFGINFFKFKEKAWGALGGFKVNSPTIWLGGFWALWGGELFFGANF